MQQGLLELGTQIPPCLLFISDACFPAGMLASYFSDELPSDVSWALTLYLSFTNTHDCLFLLTPNLETPWEDSH